jgi:hypothetical protein
LWHARLGHLSGRGITALIRDGIADLPRQPCVLPFCRTCATIKSTVAPRPRGLPANPLNRLLAHVGISGRITPHRYKAMSPHVGPWTTLPLPLPYTSAAPAALAPLASMLTAPWPPPLASASSPSVLIMTPPSAATTLSPHVMNLLRLVSTLFPTINSRMGQSRERGTPSPHGPGACLITQA